MASMVGRVRIIRVCASAALMGLVGAWTPTVAVGQAPADSSAIGARVEAYLDTWDAHDAQGLGAFFTEDADLVMGNQPRARGRREIQDSWRSYFAHQEPERHLELDVSPLHFLTPDVATMTVTTTTGGQDNEGRDLRQRKFRGAWLWQRRGDTWLIAAMRGLPLQEDSVTLNASLEAAQALQPDIRAFVAAYGDAWDAHDPGAISALYRDDAELIVRDSPLVAGREAIEAWWEAYFSESRAYRVLLIIDDIRLIAPDVALLNITATGASPQEAAEVSTPVRYARATWVITRKGDEWRIAQLLVLPSEDDQIIRSGVPGAGP